MRVKQAPIDSVRPYERNPRINDHAVKAVARSIREFGFRQPIVVDVRGVIIVGHTRWKAAKALGLKTVPVHVAADMTADQARAYRIADNRLQDLAAWDEALLAEELGALQEVDADLSALGFSAKELEALLPPAGGAGPAPGAPESVPEQWHVVIECRNEHEQTRLLRRFAREGLKCRAVIS